jgi:hypothetical protein
MQWISSREGGLSNVFTELPLRPAHTEANIATDSRRQLFYTIYKREYIAAIHTEVNIASKFLGGTC